MVSYCIVLYGADPLAAFQVLATARNASLVLVSSAALSERVTPLELFGYVITLIAFALYNYFRMRNL